VSVSSTALAGFGTYYYPPPGGPWYTSASPTGNATSYAKASSLGGNVVANASATGSNASSTAIANAGAGTVIPAIVTAHTLSIGLAGSQANSSASAASVQLSAIAKVDNTGSGTSDAIAAIGQALPAASSSAGKEAVAYGTALPLAGDVASGLAGQTIVSQDFNAAGSQAWLLGNLSVLNTASDSTLHDYQSTLNLSIDTATVSKPLNIVIGLLNPVFGANSFLAGGGDSLIFSYTISGAGGADRTLILLIPVILIPKTAFLVIRPWMWGAYLVW
jgi:hypothetical protein